ncbi:hypothetical protein HDU96_007407 [Phlyctochytrium bullatum]|nr:hypothetical protein HDU96_007407 [Phlyctochytrium bullatum]
MAPLMSSGHASSSKKENKDHKDLATLLANSALDENRIFACTKENLSQANFARDVRLASAHAISDIYAELASLSVEVNELRKTRRIEERKLRNRIIDEYDDMVSELVIENHVIRNRFSEYRTNTVQEVLGIISETKKEELHQLTKNPEIPDALRKAAEKSIKHEEMTAVMRNDIHELNMTVRILLQWVTMQLLKVRSMFTLKEQSLKASYEKRMRKITEDSRIAEEKLWDSYREAESREKALRRTLTKTTKVLG